MSALPKIRCAIYTRKSTEEGLDQDFNSLDAQYEASAAYIESQKHEGWRLISKRYDDGGVSGGTLDRPALTRLLADIENGRVDMVVVYKIDRLTRSLSDFARLVDRLDAANCSFVSVTQAFNTSTSMGRLTLNVLLSFAQFEREVTAERIRDKIAASKKRGLWMGGMVPLGYDKDPTPNSRMLVINDAEAKTVKRLFDLFEQCGSLNDTVMAAHQEGLRSKRHIFKSGRVKGGRPFSRGQLYYLLRNPIYIGKIRHKAVLHEGLHSGIVDPDQWTRVQHQLMSQPGRARSRGSLSNDAPHQALPGPRNLSTLGGDKLPFGKKSSTEPSPLIGKVVDETGDRLTPSHATKAGKRYRYYVSRRLIIGKKNNAASGGWRLPAEALEAQLSSIIQNHLRAVIDRHELLAKPDAERSKTVAATVQSTFGPKQAKDKTDAATSTVVLDLLHQCVLAPGDLKVTLNQTALENTLRLNPGEINPNMLTFATAFTQRKRGVELKLISGAHLAQPDTKLIHSLKKAHDWLGRIKAGQSIADIAKMDTCAQSHIRSLLPLAFLSPRIQTAILEGTQPPLVSTQYLINCKIDPDWSIQERQLLGG